MILPDWMQHICDVTLAVLFVWLVVFVIKTCNMVITEQYLEALI